MYKKTKQIITLLFGLYLFAKSGYDFFVLNKDTPVFIAVLIIVLAIQFLWDEVGS